MKNKIVSKQNSTVIILDIIIALIQVLDIMIHVFTGQPEMFRILSNLLILVWVIQKAKNKSSIRLGGRIGLPILYFILNITFVIFEGILNASGEFRVALFVFVFTTLLLAIISLLIEQRSMKN